MYPGGIDRLARLAVTAVFLLNPPLVTFAKDRRFSSESVATTTVAKDYEGTNGVHCTGSEWRRLYRTLDEAYTQTAYRDYVSQDVLAIIDEVGMPWYKDNYQDCVEGLLSVVLYLSHQNEARREALIELASETARELNPLALRHQLNTWPMFGLLDKLHLLWQAGRKSEPLSTEPLFASPCDLPAIVSPLMGALGSTGMDLVRELQPGAFVIDAGVFDGTDWTMHSVLAGATVIGFEASPTNLRLFQERFPLSLGIEDPNVVLPLDISSDDNRKQCRRHTVLRVEPGEPAPRIPWTDVTPAASHDAVGCADGHWIIPTKEAISPEHRRPWQSRRGEQVEVRQPGHAFVLASALGDKVRSLNITSRYDYTSVADMGYLAGPKDMKSEEVAMTTLDYIVGTYIGSNVDIDVFKVDVEGYEMGALRGAEKLLAEGRVRYIVMEFHPGMLGTTGTDPVGLLGFLRHYGFLCHSSKIDRPHDFEEFVARYTSNPKWLPLQGLGALEDLTCQNMAFGRRVDK